MWQLPLRWLAAVLLAGAATLVDTSSSRGP